MQVYPSQLRSTASRMELALANKPPLQYPWVENYSKRAITEFEIAWSMPLIGQLDGQFQWVVSLPLSATTINDIFEPNSAPILNSDYWFGIQAEFLYKLDFLWPRNIAMRVMPIFHESSHIGDEFALTIAKKKDFYRINLSYEAWEIVLGLNEALANSGNNLNLRAGISAMWNTDGYYNLFPDSEIGKETSKTYPSRDRGVEFFFQINSEWKEGFPAIDDWMFRINVELRNRILLDYFSTKNEERVWTLNSTLGWYRDTQNQLLGNLGFYLRLFYGQNPYGQFREQKDYFSMSLGFALET